jgi:hypothetical protein
MLSPVQSSQDWRALCVEYFGQYTMIAYCHLHSGQSREYISGPTSVEKLRA